MSASPPFKDRRANSHGMIDELVNVRAQMLSLYGELAAQHPFEDDESVTELLEQFCQSLIDYTADSHFRLYRFIDERKERRRAVIEIADQVYPKIVSTTQTILDFNDKYDISEHSELIEALEGDLSKLGENLADRIELEDEVIKVMRAN
ncbi:MAG TPA: Rsd/AlgQ family anti-sigma factor [Chromatiales bacterium]|nr:Rsd/AlgQ family anti-sigma factor [Chromatiales bacterium]